MNKGFFGFSVKTFINMRASRPEGFTAHTSITKTQFPYGKSLEEILRAGTAPNPEEKTPKRRGDQRVRPVRAIAMQVNPRRKFKAKEVKPSLKVGEIEDEFELEDRPPCRQNQNVYDLDDNFIHMSQMQKFSTIKETGKRGELRPPSRHKTPPKALGLELPPKRISTDLYNLDALQQDSPISSFETESFSNTMPINLSEVEKARKHIEDGKIRIKPKSAKASRNVEKSNIRMWSAAGKRKGMMDVPIIVNKAERNSLSFSTSRREKIKNEVEKRDEKRNGYFKNAPEKRASSSHNKGKINMIVPFQTNLEPEFLNLFARNEDFNF